MTFTPSLASIWCQDCQQHTSGNCSKHGDSITWIAPAEPKPYFTCPVCRGRGVVPSGFYSAIGTENWTVSDTTPEKCKTCDGRGALQ